MAENPTAAWAKKPVVARAKNVLVTPEYLAQRKLINGREARWVYFCRVMLARGLKVTLYEPPEGPSKYVKVQLYGQGKFLVRFSNHKPSLYREKHKHCDFFVGWTNLGITTTPEAIAACLARFGMIWGEQPDTAVLHQQLYGESQ